MFVAWPVALTAANETPPAASSKARHEMTSAGLGRGKRMGTSCRVGWLRTPWTLTENDTRAGLNEASPRRDGHCVADVGGSGRLMRRPILLGSFAVIGLVAGSAVAAVELVPGESIGGTDVAAVVATSRTG